MTENEARMVLGITEKTSVEEMLKVGFLAFFYPYLLNILPFSITIIQQVFFYDIAQTKFYNILCH